MSKDPIITADLTEVDYTYAVLNMPPGNVCFERGLELQLLRLAVHEVTASAKIASAEDRVMSLQALLCWVLYTGMEMQRNHSAGQAGIC